MKNCCICCLIVLFSAFNSFSQFNLEGGIKLNTEEALDGYVLYTNFLGTFLINNCGEIVNSWDITFANNHVKLLPSGNLLYQTATNLIELDWDGNTIYDYDLTSFDPSISFDYEVVKKQNGNYLSVIRKIYTNAEMLDLGFDLIEFFPYLIDGVIEVDPNTNEVVWEWYLTDHMIQNRYPDLENFADPFENPGKLNIYDIQLGDWDDTESFMINGMSYNDDKEQIILSVRKLGEVIIIDNSTTTEEAAGSEGGRYGKGGDAIFRWGNPSNYIDSNQEQILFYQHDPSWIEYGEFAGDISIFNNGFLRNTSGAPYSSIEIVRPEVDEDGNFVFDQELGWGPYDPVFRYSEPDTETYFYSDYTSGVKILENENLFVTLGKDAELVEYNKAGDLVWRYVAPQAFYIFRAEKYAKNYPGLLGKELEPMGVVENPPSEYDCMLISHQENLQENGLKVDWSLQVDHLIVESIAEFNGHFEIFDVGGIPVANGELNTQMEIIDLSTLSSGMYFFNIVDSKGRSVLVEKIIRK